MNPMIEKPVVPVDPTGDDQADARISRRRAIGVAAGVVGSAVVASRVSVLAQQVEPAPVAAPGAVAPSGA
ncbi:MAG: hypothetical protein H7247_17650, partial [Polaromonas sp.]|nr:hypothetical protein [Gemmatimonadaceae bacterium]